MQGGSRTEGPQAPFWHPNPRPLLLRLQASHSLLLRPQVQVAQELARMMRELGWRLPPIVRLAWEPLYPPALPGVVLRS